MRRIIEWVRSFFKPKIKEIYLVPPGRRTPYRIPGMRPDMVANSTLFMMRTIPRRR